MMEDKMMYQDVADISFIDLSNFEGTDEVDVRVCLEAAVVSRLQELFPKEIIHEEINFILDQKTSNPTPVLKYKGKTNIRRDVLQKFKGISELMQNQSIYPHLRLQHIKAIVKDVLGECDDRVYNEFLKTINDCLYSCSRRKLSFYENIDCSGFVITLNDKLAEKL